MDQEENKGISFDLPKNRSNVIKVMGVGGGGSNAINYMFQQGIKGVDFVISNTDAQALSESGVPIKIQLGASLTEGLGAGANPEVGAKAAQESHEQIHNILATQTKMIFITAGMGGGTGTGAAPIIAQMAKSMDILTVGIVTMPFQFEGKLRLEQAQKGLEKIKGAVDALIVINNNKLREVYGNLGFKAGFAKADEVLAKAARGIAEVITHHYTQNIDLKDAKTVLTNSGTAIMGSGIASGTNRAQEAIVKALDSPLLNDNKITGCKNVLLLIVSGSDEITIDEIGEINDYIQSEAGNHTNIIMGVGEDDSLGNEVSVTVIATGFGQEQQNEISNTEAKKIIYSLEDEQKVVHDLNDEGIRNDDQILYQKPNELADKNQFDQEISENKNPLIQMNDFLCDIEVDFELITYQKFTDHINTNTQDTLEVDPEIKGHIEDHNILNHKLPLEDEPVLGISNKESKTESEASKDDIKMFIDESIQEEVLSSLPDFDMTSTFFETEEELSDVNLSNEIKPLEDKNEGEITSNDTKSKFAYKEVEVNDLFGMEVVDPETIGSHSQIEMEFEIPLKAKVEMEQISSINDGVNDNLSQDKTIKDFDEAGLEIKFELKDNQQESQIKEKQSSLIDKTDTVEKLKDQGDPFNKSINETLASQNEKRKQHLKEFNHKFMHQMKRVDDMEKQPANKRQEMDLNSDVNESHSRTTLDTDNNDNLQIRSNNSFLHDNVD
tara:strand:+ start:5427 stop:7598 length:2172 start_codon:yes stop_codon:yes gene_type:complete